MTDDPIKRLLDERDIRRVLLDYCRGIDRGDTALVESVYHDDATDDHGSYVGPGVEFAAYAIPRLVERYEATMHTIGDSIIDFAGPDTAFVETPVTAQHVIAGVSGQEDGGRSLEWFGGRYVDRFERREGTWKIADRVVVRTWDKVEQIQLCFEPGRFTEGQRSTADISYQRL